VREYEVVRGNGGQYLAIRGLVDASEEPAVTKGKCPFPFIFLHDPVDGFKDHSIKLLVLIVAIAAYIYR